jgi:hypothetical protein
MNQGFSYYFYLLIGSESESIPLTNGSGSGRPKTCGSGSGTLLIRIGKETDMLAFPMVRINDFFALPRKTEFHPEVLSILRDSAKLLVFVSIPILV